MIAISFVQFLIIIFGGTAAVDILSPKGPSLSPRDDPRYPEDIRISSEIDARSIENFSKANRLDMVKEKADIKMESRTDPVRAYRRASMIDRRK